ncbi:MAG: penicillin-binding protein activator, partial [Gammaproteobacteria bacterium]|nr:penicillin-binding protein activator [Gammaproteobacteria bacterium]
MPVTKPTEQVATAETEAKLSARQLYQQAVNYQAEALHYHLLKAARQALLEQDFNLALAISESLRQSPYALIQRQLPLPLLQAYLATQQHSHSSRLIEQTDISSLEQAEQSQFIWLAADYLSQQQRYALASKLLLQLTQSPVAQQDFPLHQQLLWQNLSALSDSQLDALRTNA